MNKMKLSDVPRRSRMALTGKDYFDDSNSSKSHLFNYTETEANRSWLYLYESGDFHSYEANATLPKTE